MSAEPLLIPVPDQPGVLRPPLLYAGQRLDRDEFYRRVEQLEEEGLDLRGIERLEGVVHMPAAAIRMEQHGEPQGWMSLWLGTYAVATPGLQFGGPSTTKLDLDNDPEGDVFLRIRPEYGGQSTTDRKGYMQGAPELMVEIAASTSTTDLQVKFDIYRRNGVREYLVWETVAEEFYWFVLKDGDYHRQTPNDHGRLHSHVFPGLWLDVRSLLGGDLAKVLAVVQEGIGSKEHAEFVAALAGRRFP